MQQYYVKIPLVSNLIWNVLMYVAMQALLISSAGFSNEFQRFCIMTVYIPEIGGALLYYCYKYGYKQVLAKSLFEPWTLLGWIHNWIAMQGTAFVGITQTFFFYVVGILLQPYVLPASWNWSVQFHTDLYEESLRVAIYFFAILFLVCVVTLPLWKHGYDVSVQAAGRSHTMSYSETFMELLYQTSHGQSLLFTITPLFVLLQKYCNFRLNPLHMIISALEMVLLNYATTVKFCVLHQLFHKIPPLYQLTHIEHHICKGIHPTTSAMGLWEPWAMGQSALLTLGVGNNPIPYMILQSVYMGANIVVHTMWPSNQMLQYHTLHHTVLADIYNVNIPSPYDVQHSEMVPKIHSRLQELSPFVRYEALSDVLAFAVVGLSAMVMHYGFEMGMGHVDWTNRADWEYY